MHSKRMRILICLLLALAGVSIMSCVSDKSSDPLNAELASSPTGTAGSAGGVVPSKGSMDTPAIAGIWIIFASDLGVWAPTRAKQLEFGAIVWKIIALSGELRILEYDLGSGMVAHGDPERFPYEPLELEDVEIEPDRIYFRAPYGPYAYETFEFTDFLSKKVGGNYTLNDPYGGMQGSGPEYSGSITLFPYDSIMK